MELINIIKQLPDLLKTGSPYLTFPILVICAIGWLFTKSKEAAEWKGLFSKNRVEELKQARELLKECKEEAVFYDEAIHQELFHNLIGIRCCKENREIYQRLVRDGVASTEGIRLSYLFIENNNSKAEIRLGCFGWIFALFLMLPLVLGTASIPFLLQDLLLNINPSTLLIRLRNLSVVTLLFFGALKGLLPMAAALGIRIRLEKLEEKNKECASSPPEKLDSACEQTTQSTQSQLEQSEPVSPTPPTSLADAA